MKVTYIPAHLFPLSFILMCSLNFEKCIPRNVEILKKLQKATSSHVQCLCFRTCLSNVSVRKCHLNDSYLSAALTERSTLFIFVETNSWCRPSSSIASAVFRVNSAQSFSGKSMSIKQHYTHFSGWNHSHLPTAHMPWEDTLHPKF